MNGLYIIQEWNDIKNLFETEQFTSKQIICHDINIYMSKYQNQNDNELLLSLSCFSRNINYVINNLPNNIDVLLLETHSDNLIEISNLPYSIKELKIIYKDISKDKIHTFINSNKINILFNIKLPFQSIIVIKLCNIEYNVIIMDRQNIKIYTEYDVFHITK